MIAAAMGWIGTVGTIFAYLLLSRGHLQATSLRYSLLNGAGGLLGASASAAYGAWPSVVSNLLWAALAGQAIVVTLLTRRRANLARVAEVTELRPARAGSPLALCAPQRELVDAA